jgi:hypothetical protein
MGIFDAFRNLFDNNTTGNTLRDYQHASRTFVDNNMRLSPKFKHLYHVVLNFANGVTLTTNNLDNVARRELHLLVKSCDLPSFQMRTETLNQYNRKKVIQTGVQYDPIQMTWHDDQAGLSNFLWQTYFNYYYSDSQHNYTDSPPVTDAAYLRGEKGLNSGYDTGAVMQNRFGLDRPGKTDNFFTSIQIFQLHTQNLTPTNTSFTLINPIIDNWDHDEVNSEGTQYAINRMRFSYEAVIMDANKTEVGEIPAGFGDFRYDQTPSPIGYSNTTGSQLTGLDNSNKGSQAASTNQNLFGSNTVVSASSFGQPGFAQNVVEDVVTGAVGNFLFPKSGTAANITQAVLKRFF